MFILGSISLSHGESITLTSENSLNDFINFYFHIFLANTYKFFSYSFSTNLTKSSFSLFLIQLKLFKVDFMLYLISGK